MKDREGCLREFLEATGAKGLRELDKRQGYRGPLILIVERGDERSVVNAFRLGATDFMTKPLRETEAGAYLFHCLLAHRQGRPRVMDERRFRHFHDRLNLKLGFTRR